MDRFGTNVLCTIIPVGARGHESPETCGIFTTRGVIQVRQTKIMPEFVRKHTHAAVLRLDRIVADPVTGISKFDATKAVGACSFWSIRIEIDIPTVTPNGIYT